LPAATYWSSPKEPFCAVVHSECDLIWPLVAISDERWYTLQVGLTMFQGTRRTQWSLLMAGNVVATMPLIVAFIVAQKRFVATMTFTGLKG
jgi:multiple sugar transport system permease protein